MSCIDEVPVTLEILETSFRIAKLLKGKHLHICNFDTENAQTENDSTGITFGISASIRPAIHNMTVVRTECTTLATLIMYVIICITLILYYIYTVWQP